MTVEMLSMWQDHVGRGLAKVAGSEGHAGAASSADVDEAEDPTSIFELKQTMLMLKVSCCRFVFDGLVGW